MSVLPRELEELIHYYVGVFIVASNRPSVRALRRLVLKSNRDIKTRYLSHLWGMHMIPAPFFFGSDITLNLRNVFLNSNAITYFFHSLSKSRKTCYATGALDWLVNNDDEILYLPVFFNVLQRSYYIRLVHMPFPLSHQATLD